MDTTLITTSPLVKTYTLEEFWALPEPADRSKLELIAGVLFMTPPPEETHDRVVSRLNLILVPHIKAAGVRGAVYVPRAAIWTGRRTYLEPDLMYVSAELEARQKPNRRTSADLVVEVVSPGSAIYDRNTKADTYAALGVRELWLIDESHGTVEVRRLEGNRFGESAVFEGDQTVESAVFPELAFPARALFED